MLVDYLDWAMSPRRSSSQGNEPPDSAEIYRRMMLEILNTAQSWKKEQVQPEDLWDAAFRDGPMKILQRKIAGD
jgi:hypothetical protein